MIYSRYISSAAKFLVTLALMLGALNIYPQQGVPIIQSLKENLPGKGVIVIHQDQRIVESLGNLIRANAARPGMMGVRIRIFYDLGQDAGKNSLDVANSFMLAHPGVPVYRTKELDSPYFKVSVGNFRNRDEALKLLKELETQYPKAFITPPEWINFPSLYQ